MIPLRTAALAAMSLLVATGSAAAQQAQAPASLPAAGAQQQAATSPAQSPAATSPAAAQQPAADAAPAMPRMSWTSDRRSFAAGDLITIIVDEYTLASADRSTTARDDHDTNKSLSFGLNTGATGGTNIGASLRSQQDADSREQGNATHQNRITSEITLRVTQVDPSGVLHVEGKKLMKIDEHPQEVIVSGLLRPEDVAPDNTAPSWRLADAKIEATPDSKLGKAKQGIIAKILGILWP